VRLSFWGLNLGLALVVITNLFPGGVLQLLEVLQNGDWHARRSDFLGQGTMKAIERLRLPGDILFIAFGACRLFLSAGLAWRGLLRSGMSK
jgi:nitric oxide reductase subunit B